MLDLEPAGEPVVSPVTAKGDVVLRAPLRLRSEGRLAAEIATDSYRMAAGAPVVHRKFKQASPDLAEAIEAWCGPGEQKTMFGWAGGITVCMVHTSDGKANLGAPQLHIGSWWMASHVGFLSPDARSERVAVLPPETPSAFSLVFVYERLRPEGLAVRSAIEGPGLSPDARPSHLPDAAPCLASRRRSGDLGIRWLQNRTATGTAGRCGGRGRRAGVAARRFPHSAIRRGGRRRG